MVLGNDIENVGAVVAGKDFTGTFDGCGYAVKGIQMTGAALIGSLWGGTIKNVAFIDMVQTSSASNVSLVTTNYGTIDNIYLSGVIYATSAICNTIATNSSPALSGTISNVIVKAEWDENSTSAWKTGESSGLICQGGNTVDGFSNCYGISSSVAHLYGISWSFTKGDANLYMQDDGLLTALNGQLPTGFNSYWKIDANGITFGGTTVISAS